MRIAILQFAPRLGEPEWNISRADALLAEAGFDAGGHNIEDEITRKLPLRKVDLLVLPEMAFSGYNFPSLPAIQSFLEPTAAGRTASWAARTARRLHCLVAVGYPETTAAPEAVPAFVDEWSTTSRSQDANASAATNGESLLPQQHHFNSLLVVTPDGKVAAHYRKTYLYYTDATWAEASPEGWQLVDLPLPDRTPGLDIHSKDTLPTLQPLSNTVSPAPSSLSQISIPTQPSQHSLRTSFAICMDLNPQYFTAPWDAYEAANYALSQKSDLLLASMAWLSDRTELGPSEPDLQTVAYWIERLGPLLRQGLDEESNRGKGSADTETGSGHHTTRETLVILANRTGIEPGPTRACELDPVLKKAKEQARRTEHLQEEAAKALEGLVAQAARNEAVAATQAGGEPVAVLPGGNPSTLGPNKEAAGESKENHVALDAAADASTPRPSSPLGPIMSLEARYAGSSTVMTLGHGKARVFGMMGCQQEGVLVVDTEKEPVSVYSLRRRGEDDKEEEHEDEDEHDTQKNYQEDIV